MAKKAEKKDNKNLIIGICAAAVLVVVIVIVAIFATKGGATKIDDSYFVSDDTKYVVTSEVEAEDGEIAPVKEHTVYFYSDDTITGMKLYYEFENSNDAQTTYNEMKAELGSEGSIELNDKYIILTANDSELEGLTLSTIKSLQELDLDFDFDEIEE